MKQFKIIGITVRTTNENDKAMSDIPALWNKFLSYLFVNLKKVQKIYVWDLKKELGES